MNSTFRGACVLAGPAQASLIQNGDFESVTNNKFDSWTYQGSGAYVESYEVISGFHSAGILSKGGESSSYIYQSPSEAISAFVFECDFAVFSVPENGNRNLNVLLFYHPSEMINLRVGPNNILQAYGGSGWPKGVDLPQWWSDLALGFKITRARALEWPGCGFPVAILVDFHFWSEWRCPQCGAIAD